MAQTTTVAADGGPDAGGTLVAGVSSGSAPADALKLLPCWWVDGKERKDQTRSGGGTYLWPVEEAGYIWSAGGAIWSSE